MDSRPDPVSQVIEAMDQTTIASAERVLPIRSTAASAPASASAPVAVPAPEPSGSSTSVQPTKTATTYSARKLLRHDSLDRREKLLRGQEGSRQRRRWENDRLLSNPWAQPPLPSDWQVQPTHPVRNIPYYLAPLWDAAELQRTVESQLRGRKNSRTIRARRHNGPNEVAAMVPKELRARLKHNRTAKGLLQDLEEGIRAFVKEWQQNEAKSKGKGLNDNEIPLASDTEDDDDDDDDDDTVVFAGRGGTAQNNPPKSSKRKQTDRPSSSWQVSNEKLVFEGVDGDRGAGFARWLVHCVGSYYGLRTWSVTRQVEVEGSAVRLRQAYVGVDPRHGLAPGPALFTGRGLERNHSKDVELPFPLWGMV